MAPKNPSNPGVGPDIGESWPETSLSERRMAEICRNYHVYSEAICGLSPSDVLRRAQMRRTPEALREETMVVYEAQMKAGLRFPLSSLLLQLCEGWGICPGQLAPNVFTIVNAFTLACHLAKTVVLPEVFLQFYTLKRPAGHPFFQLTPEEVKVGNKMVKIGAFAETTSSWGSWKNSFFFILKDDSWGFPAFFIRERDARVAVKPSIWAGSEGERAFNALGEWVAMIVRLEDLDGAFPFTLPSLDEVVLRRVRISRAHLRPGHVDRLEQWVEGLDGDLIERVEAAFRNPRLPMKPVASLFAKKKDLREALLKKMAEKRPLEPTRGAYEGHSSDAVEGDLPEAVVAVPTKARPVSVVAPEAAARSSVDSEESGLVRKRQRVEAAERVEVSSDSCPSPELDKGKGPATEEEPASPAKAFGEPVGFLADARRAAVAPRAAAKRARGERVTLGAFLEMARGLADQMEEDNRNLLNLQAQVRRLEAQAKATEELESLKVVLAQREAEVGSLKRAAEAKEAALAEATRTAEQSARILVASQQTTRLLEDALKEAEARLLAERAVSKSQAFEIEQMQGSISLLEETAVEKDKLVEELSLRAARAEESALRAVSNLADCATTLGVAAGSSAADLVAFAQLEDKVGLELFEGETVQPPGFLRSIAERVPRVEKAFDTLAEEVVEGMAREGIRFAEGFLRCRYQVESAQADAQLDTLDATLAEEPSEDKLFEWARSGRKLGAEFPYEILPGHVEDAPDVPPKDNV